MEALFTFTWQCKMKTNDSNVFFYDMQIIPMSCWMKSEMMLDVGYVHVHEHQGTYQLYTIRDVTVNV